MCEAPAPAERDGEGPLCVVAVGGSGVGAGLLERLVAGYEAAAERVPGLRMLAVAGPRVDRERLRAPAGVEVRGYVPDLDRVLAGCDVALVQGGLTTGMELVAAGTPFVSFPLKRHFEQRIHVAHRLARHGHTRAARGGGRHARRGGRRDRGRARRSGRLPRRRAGRRGARGGPDRRAAVSQCSSTSS